jgi:hypothetical protein
MLSRMFLKRKERKERRKGPQRQHVEIIIFAVLCDTTLRFSAVKYFILRQPRNINSHNVIVRVIKVQPALSVRHEHRNILSYDGLLIYSAASNFPFFASL